MVAAAVVGGGVVCMCLCVCAIRIKMKALHIIPYEIMNININAYVESDLRQRFAGCTNSQVSNLVYKD